MDNALLLGGSLALIGIVSWLVALTVMLRRYTRVRRRLLQDPAIDQLEVTLAELLDRASKSEGDLREHRRALEHLAGLLQLSLAAPSILRYNAFEDISGSQSFTLVLLDREGTGFALTSLAGREGTRLYVKPLVQGASEIPLSHEEEQVLADATARIHRS